MSAGLPQPGDEIYLELPDPTKHRIGDRFEPWQQPSDARAWIRGRNDPQPVEITGQVQHWSIRPHDLTVTGPNWEATAKNTSEGGERSGQFTGRVHRVTSVPS